MAGVLDRLRGVEISAVVAVPLACMTLAQMGADVICVDRLEGGRVAGRWPLAPFGRNLFRAWLNKGKPSITVDVPPPKKGCDRLTRTITAPRSWIAQVRRPQQVPLDGGCRSRRWRQEP